MKVVLISMPDVAPVIIHEEAVHMPNLGIASVAGNIDEDHEVHLIDLIRKRRNIRKYLTRVLIRLRPDLVGLSAMTWQYETAVMIARLVKSLLPETRIVLGGYHATLMYREIAVSWDAELIDFIVRGEGEEAGRRLVNALAGRDRLEAIPSLSFRTPAGFVHNDRGGLLDLVRLKRPVRDARRLTSGYHVLYNKIEVMETSRGCTRACNYCSIRHMYGKSFRTYSISRVIEDLDDIYVNRRTRWVFISDDNLVLDPERVIALCDAIIARRYRGLCLVIQADCITMARESEMVRKMALAGVKSVFLGIENALPQNLIAAKKGDITGATWQAVANCHQYGIMVIGGMILGFPDDDATAIIRNYAFFKSMSVDAAYCQILTPYPKTGIRESLMMDGLITNPFDYTKYNGMWANVRTRHLRAAQLQYCYWYYRQTVLGWWQPSGLARRDGRVWTGIWRYLFKPVLKYGIDRTLRKHGWEGRFDKEMARIAAMNRFDDLADFADQRSLRPKA